MPWTPCCAPSCNPTPTLCCSPCRHPGDAPRSALCRDFWLHLFELLAGTAACGSPSSAAALALYPMLVIFFISPFPALVPSSLTFARLNPAPRLFPQVKTFKFSSANGPVSTPYRAPSIITCRALTRHRRCGYLPASSSAASPLQLAARRTLQWLLEVCAAADTILASSCLLTEPLLADAAHTLENAIAYESPQVTSVAPKNSPMYGGFFVTLLGRHFGHVDTTVRFLCHHASLPPLPSLSLLRLTAASKSAAHRARRTCGSATAASCARCAAPRELFPNSLTRDGAAVAQCVNLILLLMLS